MATRETVKDRAQKAAAERKAAADAALPPGTEGNGNGGEVVKTDPLRNLLDSFEPEIARQLPRHIRADAFLRVALTGMRTSKQARALAKCTRPSLFAALLEAARYGLMPFTEEAAIVPFGDQATFIPQYQGLVQMFYNTGQVSSVTSGLIHSNDKWELSYGDGGRFYHQPLRVAPDGSRPDRGPAIMAYFYVTLKDGSRTEVTTVTRWEAEDIRDQYSRSYQNAEKYEKYDSAWHTNFDEMMQKTAVRKGAKFTPKSPELRDLLMLAARDDLNRQEPVPPPPPPPVAGVDIDWSADVNGGKIVAGTVVTKEEDGAPWPGDDSGHAATVSLPEGDRQPARDGPAGPVAFGPEEYIPVGAEQAADEPAANVSRETFTPAETGEKITSSTAAKLGAVFTRAGWTGKDNQDKRLFVAGILATGCRSRLVLSSAGQLTEAQGQVALATVDALRKAAEREGVPADGLDDAVVVKLQRIYDAETAKTAEGQ